MNLDKENFNAYGYLVVRDFFDIKLEIRPIQEDIKTIICLVAKQHNVLFTDTGKWWDGYLELQKKDRKLSSIVYDAVKQLASLHKLMASDKVIKSIKYLRGGCIGIARNGFGIRIDDPQDIKYKTNWHQDYSGQLRSPLGVTLWSPLMDVSPELGPVTFARSSHLEGVFPIRTIDRNFPDIKVNADAYNFDNEDEIVNKYVLDTPLINAGDAVFIDFLNAHRSGHNFAEHSRWTMQLRYFDFTEEVGLSHGWSGGIASNVDFKKIHPEMYVA